MQQPTFLYIGASRYSREWHSIPHAHPNAELFYVVGGRGRFRIEDLLLEVEQEDLILVNPLVKHTELGLEGEPLEYIVLGFEGFELAAAEGQDPRYRRLNFQGSGADVLIPLRQMLQEDQRSLPEHGPICQALLQVVLLRLQRQFHYTSASQPQRLASPQCAAVRRYIDGHFKEPLTLDLLARVARVNKYHMAHAFTREYGISPISYLNQRRIAESCYLLQTTDMTLGAIAETLGFSSASYFSQRFHRHKGISPMAYRQRSRQRQEDG